MRKRVLLFATIALASLGAGMAVRARYQSSIKFKPYTITWQVTDYEKDGNAIPQYVEVRHQASDGKWHDVKKWTDGGTEESFAEPGRGVFAIRKDKLVFVSQALTKPNKATAEQWRSSPQFLRYDSVQGLPTVVIKVGGDNPAVEQYLAPTLNNDWVKVVMRYPDYTRVIEPILIDFNEPAPGLFSHPDLPVDRSTFEKIQGDRPVTGQ